MTTESNQSGLTLTAIIDGASRSVQSTLPGGSTSRKAGIGVIVRDENGRDVQRFHRYIGEATNNVAEYQALIACLGSLRDFPVKSLKVYSDSELLVKQMQGVYRVKNGRLRELFRQAWELIKKSGYEFHIEHVKREFTKEADRLANQAINSHEALEM